MKSGFLPSLSPIAMYIPVMKSGGIIGYTPENGDGGYVGNTYVIYDSGQWIDPETGTVYADGEVTPYSP